MSNLDKLKQLLENPTEERMLQVMFEKDQPLGKEVMDIVRILQAEKQHIPTIGNFKFQPIWSFGKLTYVVSLHDKELHERLLQVQREQWAAKLKGVMEELFSYPDGHHTGSRVYDHMQGNYPALKVFEQIARAYFQVKKKEGREPTNAEYINLKIDPNLKRSKIALHAIRHFDT